MNAETSKKRRWFQTRSSTTIWFYTVIIIDLVLTGAVTIWLIASEGIWYGGPPRLLVLVSGIVAIYKMKSWAAYIFIVAWLFTGLTGVAFVIAKLGKAELWTLIFSFSISAIYLFGAWLGWKRRAQRDASD